MKGKHFKIFYQVPQIGKGTLKKANKNRPVENKNITAILILHTMGVKFLLGR